MSKVDRVLHWHPFDWHSLAPVARVAVGDVVHNPVYRKDCDETRTLAEKVDEALAKRGLKIDHAACLIGFVEQAEQANLSGNRCGA